MNFSNFTIKEIKEYLSNKKIKAGIITKLENDPRKGVKNIARKYKKARELRKNKIEKWKKMNIKLDDLHNRGYELIAGIDEAGRGPLAGPVVAAAVILSFDKRIIGLDDSKKLSIKERENLYKKITKNSFAIGVGIIDNKAIDKYNIQQATFMAMVKAIKNLDIIPDYLLIDGNKKIPELSLPQEPVVNGDAKVNAIAAASIIAKVTRDNIIDRYHSKYPQYRLINNKGYGTEEHIEALKKYGATPLHRMSFKVVEKYKNGEQSG